MAMMRRSSTVSLRSSSSIDACPSSGSLPQLAKQQQQQQRRRGRRQGGRRRSGFVSKTRATAYGGGALVLLTVLMMCFRSYIPGRVLETKSQKTPGFRLNMNSAPSCDAPLDAADVSFTLVSQFSSDRIWMMEHHCARWGTDHRMSLAILSNATHSETLQSLIDLGCDAAAISLTVVDARNYPYDDYPVNVLRNVAFERATETSHIAYVDVDFWESEDMHDNLSHPDIRQSLADDPQLALVMPAFQLWRQCREWKDCRDKNIPLMPHTKSDLVKLIKSKKANMFDPTNPGGHGTTDYNAWLKQDLGTLVEIQCLRSKRYEPFLVMRRCKELPPFQEQFSGYGKNKMTWMMQMIRSGYNLAQVGGVYLVHYPHLDSASRQTWNQSPKSLSKIFKDKHGNRYKRLPKDVKEDYQQYKRGQVDRLFVQFRSWLVENVVPDRTRVPMCEEAQDDDAKLWVGREEEKEN